MMRCVLWWCVRPHDGVIELVGQRLRELPEPNETFTASDFSRYGLLDGLQVCLLTCSTLPIALALLSAHMHCYLYACCTIGTLYMTIRTHS